MSRVLIVLLLEVLQQHLSVLIVKLVQVDHHLLLVFVIITLLVVVVNNTVLLLGGIGGFVLELLELLGDVDVKFLFFIIIVVLLLGVALVGIVLKFLLMLVEEISGILLLVLGLLLL